MVFCAPGVLVYNLFCSKIVDLFQNLVRQDIQSVIKMSLLITKELNVLDDEGVTGLSLCSILCAGRVETNPLVMSNAVAECFDILEFVVDSPLPKAFCSGRENLKDGLTAKTERDPVEKIGPEPKSYRRYDTVIRIFSRCIQICNR